MSAMVAEQEKTVDLLRRLTAIHAPAGAEERMIDLMKREFARLGAQVRVDSLGNVIACLHEEQPGQPILMFLAHMDQIGLVVRKIEPSGYLRVNRLGGVPEKSLAGQRVLVLGSEGPIPGLLGTKSHHATRPEEKYKVIPVDDMYLDICAADREAAARMGVAVGNLVVYEPRFYRCGDLVQATSLDNRAGCTVLLRLAERLAGLELQCGVYLVGSVMEEYNLRGILPAVRSVQPTVAIDIDVALACDTPDLFHLGDLCLGRGPAVNLFSFHGRGELNGVIPNPKLSKFVLDTAARCAIPVQRNVFFGGLTDASYVQLEGPGIPAIDIGIPVRYSHAPIEACAVSDIIATAELMAAVAADFSPDLDLSRG